MKARTFTPLPVRERMIPKPGSGGKLRRLGIPTSMDRLVQAALVLVLEPIFEASFKPVSYGFRPERRAHDAIAEVHHFGTKGYHWVLDADIEACFDNIAHSALLERMRRRVGDKRVLALVKAFLKAGIMSADGVTRDTNTGTPQGGIASPLLANIALSALDEHFCAKWDAHGNGGRRTAHRRRGGATYRIVRYADDFLIMVCGTQAHADALWEEVTAVLAPLGLRQDAVRAACPVRRAGRGNGLVTRPVPRLGPTPTAPTRCRSSRVEAEGSLIRVMPRRVRAALTKPGRVQYCQMGRVRQA